MKNLMVVHVELPSPNAMVVRVLCGEAAVIFDDGTLAPAGFDFCMYDRPHLATCTPCRRAADIEPATAEGAVDA